MYSDFNILKKEWADYTDDETLPVIPWIKNITAEPGKKNIYEQWITVKHKKKRK